MGRNKNKTKYKPVNDYDKKGKTTSNVNDTVNYSSQKKTYADATAESESKHTKSPTESDEATSDKKVFVQNQKKQQNGLQNGVKDTAQVPTPRKAFINDDTKMPAENQTLSISGKKREEEPSRKNIELEKETEVTSLRGVAEDFGETAKSDVLCTDEKKEACVVEPTSVSKEENAKLYQDQKCFETKANQEDQMACNLHQSPSEEHGHKFVNHPSSIEVQSHDDSNKSVSMNDNYESDIKEPMVAGKKREEEPSRTKSPSESHNTNSLQYQLRLVVVSWVGRYVLQELLRKVNKNPAAGASVDLEELDITELMKQLNESEFPVLRPNAKEKHCTNNSNSLKGQVKHKGCCEDCDRSNQEHKKDKKTCIHCKTTWQNCEDNQYVCCEEDVNFCKFCLNCVVKNTQSESWRDLFQKLKQCDDPEKINHGSKSTPQIASNNLSSSQEDLINICPSQKLRMCVFTIKILRNLTMHLTPKECQEIETAKYTKDPFFKSWKDIKETISYALKFSLNYLEEKGCITSDKVKENVNILIDVLTPYFVIPLSTQKIEKFLSADQEFKSLNDCGQKMNELLDEFKKMTQTLKTMTNKLIVKMEVAYSSSGTKRFHLDCSEAKSMKEKLKESANRISTNEYTYDINVTNFASTSEPKRAQIEIKISSENLSLKEYNSSDTSKSKDLFDKENAFK
eukprot:TCONS_00000132-protein